MLTNSVNKSLIAHLHIPDQVCKQNKTENGDEYGKWSFTDESTCSQSLSITAENKPNDFTTQFCKPKLYAFNSNKGENN